MVKYHPVHVTKNRIKTDDVTDIYFVEPFWKEGENHIIESLMFFEELQKSFNLFNHKHGLNKYILRIPWEFVLIHMERISKLNSVWLFAVSVDFNNNHKFLSEYIRSRRDYGMEVWFDFCGKHSYSSEIKNLGFFFQACVVPRDPNFISSVYHYHKFQKILVGDINDVEQRAVYQNEVDYMYGMQWPSSYDGFFFRDHKKNETWCI
ncbi:TioA protein [Salmonella enterica]|nr:TioA protein [Salmonella enterica]